MRKHANYTFWSSLQAQNAVRPYCVQHSFKPCKCDLARERFVRRACCIKLARIACSTRITTGKWKGGPWRYTMYVDAGINTFCNGLKRQHLINVCKLCSTYTYVCLLLVARCCTHICRYMGLLVVRIPCAASTASSMLLLSALLLVHTCRHGHARSFKLARLCLYAHWFKHMNAKKKHNSNAVKYVLQQRTVVIIIWRWRIPTFSKHWLRPKHTAWLYIMSTTPLISMSKHTHTKSIPPSKVGVHVKGNSSAHKERF